MAGSIKTSVKSINEGTSKINNKSKSKNRSLSLSELRQPVIHPHEFSNLGKEMVLITPKGFCLAKKVYWYKLNKDKEIKEEIRVIF